MIIDCVYSGLDIFMDVCYKLKNYKEILLEIRTENSWFEYKILSK
jgi:hypothetical protein